MSGRATPQEQRRLPERLISTLSLTRRLVWFISQNHRLNLAKASSSSSCNDAGHDSELP